MFSNIFKKPDREISVKLGAETYRFQQRGWGADAKFCLRISHIGQVEYKEIKRQELLNLSSALAEFVTEIDNERPNI